MDTRGRASTALGLPQRSFALFPERIVCCLTEETKEIFYLLGERDRVAGVSGYTLRPPETRAKPRLSAFVTARYDEILALEGLNKDLVRGTKDDGPR